MLPGWKRLQYPVEAFTPEMPQSQKRVALVQRANMLIGDIGETALLARHDQLETVSMRLFHPLKFMLASPIATSSGCSPSSRREAATSSSDRCRLNSSCGAPR